MASITDVRCKIVSLVLVLGLCWRASSTPVKMGSECGDDYRRYYDHGTDNCEDCREICLHAEILGTVQQCDTNCPKFLHSLECEEGQDQYYDEAVDMCAPCSQLCASHAALGTTSQCLDRCPVYMAKLSPEQVPSLHEHNSLKAVGGGSEDEEDDGPLLSTVHPGWIAASVMGLLAIVAMVLAVVVIYKTCSPARYQEAPQQDPAATGKNRTPVEETRPEAPQVLAISSDSGASQLGSNPPVQPPQTGFTELNNDVNRGHDSNRTLSSSAVPLVHSQGSHRMSARIANPSSA